ncbi:MAG TPA: YggT family protein [Acidimicrobiales bacterium]|nr:YggT family protein [Acidimicrobiales bacterium]
MIFTILWWLCVLFLAALWARIIFSYLSVMPGSTLDGLNRWATTITDPLLRPVRRVLPPARIGQGALDLSPIVVSIAVIILMNWL